MAKLTELGYFGALGLIGYMLIKPPLLKEHSAAWLLTFGAAAWTAGLARKAIDKHWLTRHNK
jgi:hypothetical protein